MILIPKILHVGFKNADSKLSYVTYEDDKGVMRQAQSFNNWVRGNKVQFDNEPVTGVMLDSGSNSPGWGGWNKRLSIARIVDPRGFMFEIRMENLVYMLQTGGYDGRTGFPELIYSWDSGKIVLIPTASPEYQDALVSTEVQSKYLKVADIKVGATYLRKSGDEYTYLGKFPVMKYNRQEYSNTPDGERHVFASYRRYDGSYDFELLRNLSGKFIQKISGSKGIIFDEAINDFFGSELYKQIDRSKDARVYLTHHDIVSSDRWLNYVKTNIGNTGFEYNEHDDRVIVFRHNGPNYYAARDNKHMSVDEFIDAYAPYKTRVFFEDGTVFKDAV